MTDKEMSGHPRLVLAAGGGALADSPHGRGEEIAFPLHRRHTTIGSDPGQDVVLEGLAPEHAVVDWFETGDEWVFSPLPAAGIASLDGKPVVTGLHNGDRLELGPWILVFQRDGADDHIRVEGARQGGDYAGDNRHRPGGHANELS